MNEFTRFCILYTITGSPFSPALSFYLVPVTTPDNRPDFERIYRFTAKPSGNSDWSGISQNDYSDLVIRNGHRIGRLFTLRRFRPDLSPMSTPGVTEKLVILHIVIFGTRNGLGRITLSTCLATDLSLKAGFVVNCIIRIQAPMPHFLDPLNGALLPQSVCLWFDIALSVVKAFEVLLIVCHRITHLYRARCAQFELRLSPISHNLLIEALTLPSASFPFNNQRLETLGDAVLQLCTTVHLFNYYPNRQLSNLRQ